MLLLFGYPKIFALHVCYRWYETKNFNDYF